ncbi:putative mediator of RNA polymerase II transcription subunit 19b [Drosera capensis]
MYQFSIPSEARHPVGKLKQTKEEYVGAENRRLRFVGIEYETTKQFSRPRELTGAIDLINHYKLLPHPEFFCKKSLPSSISDTHYLHYVVGETDIRKGEGMQLDQLTEYPYPQNGNAHIQPLDLDILGEAFHLRETAPLVLPPEDKGTPTIAGKSKGEARDKETKHKKSKDRDKERDKENKKHKHRHKDGSKGKDRDKDKEKKNDKSRHQDPGAKNSKISHEKKRKHDGEEDINEMNQERKSKHKSSKMEGMGTIKSHHRDALRIEDMPTSRIDSFKNS